MIETFQISAAVCFLLSPAAAFINGETLKVDAGHSLYAPSSIWQIPGMLFSLLIIKYNNNNNLTISLDSETFITPQEWLDNYP